MPVYEYECEACDRVFEVQQRISDDPLTECPQCGGKVKKLISMSAFHLKGGGWYRDGYSSGGSGKNGGGEGTSGKQSSGADKKEKAPACSAADSGKSCCKNCPAAT